ncbi:MAG: SprB repeat-containing protein [Saprospiraceae bacterium]|nr:SprB repeat-containing protein [Saprospiraceae bacterium]
MSILQFIWCLLVLLPTFIFSQPKKQWTKSYGGNGGEYTNKAIVFDDSLILAVGRSNSSNLGSKGLDDGALCFFNKNGGLNHIKTFGSPSNDVFNGVSKMPNGNLICAGNANGQGGDVSTQYGLLDGWMLMYNPITRMKVWEKNYGGSNNDQINDVSFLEAGKIIFVGGTRSTDRDLNANKGNFDIMVGTADESGTVVRVRNFGGTREDIARKIMNAGGGEFWVAGETQSSEEGDFNGLKNKGGRDIFLMRFNRNTSLLKTTIYGSLGDDLVGDMVAFRDGSVLIASTINGGGGDVDSTYGSKDIFLLKLDREGSILWKKTIGGTGDEELSALVLDQNEEIILLTSSNSADGHFPINYGEKDINIVKLDKDGNHLWTQNYGGRRTETEGSIAIDDENLIFTVNASFSIDRDLDTSNTNTPNFWIMHLYECPYIENEIVREICLGDSVEINGKLYYLGNDKGFDTLVGSSFRGCDSVLKIQVYFNSPSTEFLRDTLCDNGTATINGVVFDKNKKDHVFLLSNQYGCDSNLIVNLHFTEPISIRDTTIVHDNGTGNGRIQVNLQGGTGPYIYNWSNGFSSSQIVNLIAGRYTLTVTDARSCVEMFSFIVRSTVSSDNQQFSNIKWHRAQESWFFELESGLESIEIFSPEGQNLFFNNDSSQRYECNVQSLPEGLLIAVIKTMDGRQQILKFVNHR